MKMNKDNILKEEDILDKAPEGYHPTSYIYWYDFKNYPNEGASLIQKWSHIINGDVWVSIGQFPN
jgi:hypothetical protein